jgi:hypothetical protein
MEVASLQSRIARNLARYKDVFSSVVYRFKPEISVETFPAIRRCIGDRGAPVQSIPAQRCPRKTVAEIASLHD